MKRIAGASTRLKSIADTWIAGNSYWGFESWNAAILTPLTGDVQEIKETLADHGSRLGRLEGQMSGVITKLAEHSTILAEHSTILAEHSSILAEHTTDLREIKGLVGSHAEAVTGLEIKAHTH